MTEPRQDTPNDPQLSRRYREQALAEPSAAIDQHILAAARQAVAPQAQRSRRPGWWQRWRLPLSLATTIMLTVTLALLVERQPKELSAVSDRANKRTESAPQRTTDTAGTTPPAESASPAPVAPAAPIAKPESRANTRERDFSGASDSAAGAAAKAQPPPARTDSLPPPVPEASEAGAGSEVRAAPALSAPRPAAAAMAKSRADSTRSPDSWLEEIRALRRAGKTEEAERQLREFRLAHPDHLLPEEFRR